MIAVKVRALVLVLVLCIGIVVALGIRSYSLLLKAPSESAPVTTTVPLPEPPSVRTRTPPVFESSTAPLAMVMLSLDRTVTSSAPPTSESLWMVVASAASMITAPPASVPMLTAPSAVWLPSMSTVPSSVWLTLMSLPMLLMFLFLPEQYAAFSVIPGVALYLIGLHLFKIFDVPEMGAVRRVLPLDRLKEKIGQVLHRKPA